MWLYFNGGDGFRNRDHYDHNKTYYPRNTGTSPLH